MARGLLRAWLLVMCVLQALATDAAVPAVVDARDQARAAVRDLPDGQMAQALDRVLVQIDLCRQAGVRGQVAR